MTLQQRALFAVARREEKLYFRLTLKEKHKVAYIHWNTAKTAWEDLAKTGWRPTQGCVDWHGAE